MSFYSKFTEYVQHKKNSFIYIKKKKTSSEGLLSGMFVFI